MVSKVIGKIEKQYRLVLPGIYSTSYKNDLFFFLFTIISFVKTVTRIGEKYDEIWSDFHYVLTSETEMKQQNQATKVAFGMWLTTPWLPNRSTYRQYHREFFWIFLIWLVLNPFRPNFIYLFVCLSLSSNFSARFMIRGEQKDLSVNTFQNAAQLLLVTVSSDWIWTRCQVKQMCG